MGACAARPRGSSPPARARANKRGVHAAQENLLGRDVSDLRRRPRGALPRRPAALPPAPAANAFPPSSSRAPKPCLPKPCARGLVCTRAMQLGANCPPYALVRTRRCSVEGAARVHRLHGARTSAPGGTTACLSTSACVKSIKQVAPRCGATAERTGVYPVAWCVPTARPACADQQRYMRAARRGSAPARRLGVQMACCARASALSHGFN